MNARRSTWQNLLARFPGLARPIGDQPPIGLSVRPSRAARRARGRGASRVWRVEALEPRLLLDAVDPTSDPLHTTGIAAIQQSMSAGQPTAASTSLLASASGSDLHMAGAPGLSAEELAARGVRAIEYQGQTIYAYEGQWMVRMDTALLAGAAGVMSLDGSGGDGMVAGGDRQALAESLLNDALWSYAGTHADVYQALTRSAAMPTAEPVLGVEGESISPTRVFRGVARPTEAASAVSVREEIADNGTYLLDVSGTLSHEHLAAAFGAVPGFGYVEPNALLWAEATRPGDPQYGNLYGMEKISAPQAWDLTTSSGEVVIAVVDTGVDYNHPDLSANMWRNIGEVAGDGIDNDGNGFVDDVYGYDFVNNDGNPMDDHRHGTHVAGTLGAVGDNGVGVAGVNWSTKIMALKFLDSGGYGSSADAARALNYAAMMAGRGVNIRVTNNSWGGGGYLQSLYDSIVANRDANILFVAASGNNGQNIDSSPSYPACYNVENVVSVGSTDQNDQLSWFSNYGASNVDLAAPGYRILSTTPGGTYTYLDGTSMASPHVAGAAGMLFGYAGSTATYQQIKDALLLSVDKVSALNGRIATGGRLNVYNALQQLDWTVLSSNPTADTLVTAPLTAFTVNLGADISAASVQASDFKVNNQSADSFTLIDSRTVRFQYSASPLTVEGVQQMSIAQGALTRASDGRGIKAWSASFLYDGVKLAVESSTPASGTMVPVPVTDLWLTFNEPVDPASIDVSDFTLSQGYVSSIVMLDDRTVQLRLGGVTDENAGNLTVSAPAGAFSDPAGFTGLAWSASFPLDSGNATISDFTALPLAGSLVYEGSRAGLIAPAGDSDEFLLELDPGQSVSLVLECDPTLKAAIELFDPQGQSLGSATAAAAGGKALIDQTAIGAGVYRVVVTGVGTTTGGYQVRATLNAGIEAESVGGASNDTLVTAQNLDGYFTAPADGAAARAAVVGSAPAVTLASDSFEDTGLGSAWTTYSSQAGGRIRTSNQRGSAQGFQALLMDRSSSGLDTLNEAVWNVNLASADRAFLTFSHADFGDEVHPFAGPFVGHYQADGIAISTNGSYWIPIWNAPDQVDGQWQSYSIDLTAAARNAGLTLGSTVYVKLQQYDNGGIPDDGRGYDNIAISTVAAAPEDWYKLTLTPGEPATIALAVDQGDPPVMELYDASGRRVAVAEHGTAPVAQAITRFNAPSAGVYHVRIVGAHTRYNLVVSRSADLDITPNNDFESAPALTHPTVLGAIDNPFDEDLYQVYLGPDSFTFFSTGTPGGGPLSFDNALDPQLELYDPQFNLYAFDYDSGDDGRNAVMGAYVPEGYEGWYYVKVSAFGSIGEYTLQSHGLSLPPATLAVESITPTDGSFLIDPPAQAAVVFSDPLLLTSLDAGDLTIDGLPATHLSIIDARTVLFTLPTFSDGEHTLRLSAGGVVGLDGAPLDDFTSRFWVDFNPPTVVDSSIAAGSVVPTGPLVWNVTLHEEIDTDHLDPSDVTLVGSVVGGVTPASVTFDPATRVLSAVFAEVVEDAYTLTLLSGDGRIEDPAGNDLDGDGDGIAGGHYSVSFQVDPTLDGTLAVAPVQPLGSLVQSATASQKMRYQGDADRYRIDLAAGQSLVAAVLPDSGLRPTLELTDADGTVLAGVTASATGGSALLPLAADLEAGTYFLRITAADSSLGTYELRTYLNTALEQVGYGGAAHGSRATAQDLDAAFTAPVAGSDARIAAVVRDSAASSVAREDFEQGVLASGWTTYSSDASGRVQITSGYGASDGTRALWMDRNPSGGFTLNEATWTVNLGGLSSAYLSFAAAESNDEEHPFAPGGFTGHANADGIAISADGVTWHPIWSAPGQSANLWTSYNIDLVQAAQSAGIGLNSDFRIRFQQYDDTPLPADGRGFDRVRITSSAPMQDWYRFSVPAGGSVSLALQSLDGVDLSVALYDEAGTLVASGAGGAANVQQFIADVGAAADSTYYARVSGPASRYNLVAVRNGDFEVESNEALDAAQDLTLTGSVIGHVSAAGVDHYRINANAGDLLQVTLARPGLGGEGQQPGNSLVATLSVLDHVGNVLAWAAADQPLAYTVPADASGTYYLRVQADATSGGAYALSVDGSTGTLPAFSVTGTFPTMGQELTAIPATLDVDFNDAVLPGSVNASDLKVNGLSATAAALVDGNTVRFTLPTALTGTLFNVTLAAGAIVDLQGTPLEAFDQSFTVDSTAPRIVDLSITQGQVVPTGELSFVAVFNEAIRSENLDASDFSLVGATTGTKTLASFAFDPDTRALTLNYSGLGEDSYTLTIHSGDGRIEDRAGNDLDGEAVWPLPSQGTGNGVAGGNFTVGFEADIDSVEYPVTLTAVGRMGSRVYQSSSPVRGQLRSASDTDTYRLTLDAGQRLTVLLDPVDAALAPRVTIYGPDGSVVGSASATAAGLSALMQSADLGMAGEYRIVIAAVSGSGRYDLSLTLNAAHEAETDLGAANNDMASAQSLDATWTAAGAAMRTAVSGSIVAGEPPTRIPLYTQNFNSTVPPASGWSYYSYSYSSPQHDKGRIRAGSFNGVGTAAGSGALVMDCSLGSEFALNEADWTVNLAGKSEAYLTFWAIDINDEEHGFGSTTSFTGHYDADGICISTDGVTWHPVWTAPNQSGWREYTLDLAALAQSRGLGLTSSFRIRFQQYDNGFTTGDGRGWDEITLSTNGPAQDWYKVNLGQGERLSLALQVQSGTDPALELYNAAGQRVVTAQSSAQNVSALIQDYQAPEAGTYYARVLGENLRYTVELARNASIDAEGNGSMAQGQSIHTDSVVLGGLTEGDVDFYSFDATAGHIVTLWTSTPGDGSGELEASAVGGTHNALDPRLVLMDAQGQELLIDESGGLDQKNAAITWVVPTTGRYTVCVDSVASPEAALGEYVLHLGDAVPPTVVAGTDPSVVFDGGVSAAPISDIAVRLNGELAADSAVNADHHELRGAGADGIFGGEDDTLIGLSASYLAAGDNTSILTLAPVGGSALGDGRYRLTMRSGPAEQGLHGPDGQAIDGDGDGLAGGDFVREFTVDQPGILIDNLGSNELTESGGFTTLRVVLASRPSADVAIPIVIDDATEAHADVTELIFTPDNWDQPRFVTLTGQDDFVDDGDQPVNVAIGPAVSDDGDYLGIDPDDLLLSNLNDDRAGVRVEPTSGLITTEAGGSASFTVVLTSQPTAPVSIALASDNPAEGLTDPTILNFDDQNWNVPQTVTVAGVDDDVHDGDVAYSVVLDPVVSDDPIYHQIDPDNVGLTNLDDDPADAVAPTVTGVYVQNSAWGSTFRNGLASPTLGHAIEVGSGSAQLRSLPWAGIDTLSIRFSEDVVVALSDLRLLGSAVTEYSLDTTHPDPADGSGFEYGYDAATDSYVATWKLTSALGADKLLVLLGDTVTDRAGNALDGQWDQPTASNDPASDAFPSGDGTAGGDFAFRFNVLPGDANGNGSVNSLDLSAVKAKLGTAVGGAGYSPWSDVNANGSTNSLDLSFVKARLGTSLSGLGEPVVPSSPSMMALASILDSETSAATSDDGSDASSLSPIAALVNPIDWVSGQTGLGLWE